MLKVDLSIVRYFEDDNGTSIVTFEKQTTEEFKSSEDLAAWLVFEGMEEEFSQPEFSPEGFWSAPLFSSPISGLQEKRCASRHGETTELQWRDVYEQLNTVRAV